MKQHRLWLGLVLIALLTIAGCGDDDCPTCPEETQSAVALCRVVLQDGNLFANGDVVGVNGQLPDLDSLRVRGLPAEFGPSSLAPGSIHFGFGEYESGLVSTDTVLVEFFSSTGVSRSQLKLLSTPEDEIELVSGYVNYDSGATASFSWNRSPNAEWSYIETKFTYRDSTGEVVYPRHFYLRSGDDTTLTIPGSSLAFNGILTVTLQAGTGPSPASTDGNISGGPVRGRVWCSYERTFHMFIGSGVATKTGLMQPEPPKNGNLW